MALLIKTDGTESEIVLPEKDPLQFLYSMLDCDMVEFLPLCPGRAMKEGYDGALADEEARLTGKEVNEKASEFSGRHRHEPMYHILGDCVFYKPGEIT